MAKKKISDKEKVKDLKSEVSTLKKQMEKQEANISFTVKNSKPGVEIFIPMEAITHDMNTIVSSYVNTQIKTTNESNNLMNTESFDTVPVEDDEPIEEEPVRKNKKDSKYKKVVVTGGVSWGKVGIVIALLVIGAIYLLVKLS